MNKEQLSKVKERARIEGMREVLEYLSDVYEGVEDTDIWADAFGKSELCGACGEFLTDGKEHTPSTCSASDQGEPLPTLELRTAQLVAFTDEERDNDDESHPIIHAESGPNRYAVMSLFFSDNDGVRIEEDTDLHEITISYFADNANGECVEQEITEGALYDWALEFFNENWSN